MKSSAWVAIAWCSEVKAVVVEWSNGSIWAYPATPQEWATMHRCKSAGNFFNLRIKPRGGIEVKTKPVRKAKRGQVSKATAILSGAFTVATGLA